MMRRDELERWMEKNLRDNSDRILKAGDIVKDRYGVISTVVEVYPPHGRPSVRNHGSIKVKTASGSENHYVWFGWEKNLRIVTF